MSFSLTSQVALTAIFRTGRLWHYTQDVPELIARNMLLAEIERLATEARALVPKTSSLEEKQKLLDASLYLGRSLSCIKRVKDKLGED